MDVRSTISAEDRFALHDLVAALWERTDRVVEARAEDLFASDAEMAIGTLKKSGHAEIAAYNIERRAQEDASGRRTRHAASNIIIESTRAGGAELRFLCTVFAGSGQMPFPSSAPSNIADFSASCVKADDGAWKFKSLRASPVFFGENAPSNAR